MQLFIIYTEHDVLLSKRGYASWQEIQDAHADYKASLGPWPADDVAQYLADEHATLSPSAQAQVSAFLAGPDETRALTFPAAAGAP